jgi:hypothetical protein
MNGRRSWISTALRNDSAVSGGTCLVPLPLTRHVFLSANAPRKCTGLFSFAPGGAGGILRQDSKTAFRLNDSAVSGGTCLVPLPLTRHVFLSANAPRKCTGLFSFAPGGAGGILRQDSKTALRLMLLPNIQKAGNDFPKRWYLGNIVFNVWQGSASR